MSVLFAERRSSATVWVEHCVERREGVSVWSVVDVHAASFGFDEVGLAQLCEVVADGRFGEAQRGGQVAV
jgi:hypothetical protein